VSRNRAEQALGYAIVGCGRVSTNHLAGVEAAASARLAAVCDIVPERARAAARSAGIRTWETDYRRLLERPDIDIVDICLPHHLHCPAALASLEAGKHVLCEKPIATNARDARRMIAAAERRNLQLGIVYQNRYNAASVKLRELIAGDRFGRLAAAACTMYNRKDQSYYRDGWHGAWKTEGGGTLTTQASHNLDLICWFLGEPVSAAAYTASLTHAVEVEDTAALAVEFANGAVASLVSTNCSPLRWHQRLELIGTEGAAVMENNRIVQWRFSDAPASAETRSFGDEDVDAPLAGAAGYGPSHPRLIADFVDAVASGRPFGLDGREGARASRVLWAAYRSAKTGRREKVRPLE